MMPTPVAQTRSLGTILPSFSSYYLLGQPPNLPHCPSENLENHSSGGGYACVETRSIQELSVLFLSVPKTSLKKKLLIKKKSFHSLCLHCHHLPPDHFHLPLGLTSTSQRQPRPLCSFSEPCQGGFSVQVPPCHFLCLMRDMAH